MTEVELVANRLASYLHDQVMPWLAISLFRADRVAARWAAGQTGDGAMLAELEALRTELAESLERLRHLAASLKRVQRATQLRAALEASAAAGLAARRGQPGGEADGAAPEISFELNQAPALPPDITEVICQVVREGVANAVRHGRARQIRVELRREPGRIRLEVADDGTGFDRSKLAELGRRGHLGLALLRQAVRARGGRLRVSSRPGGGTRVLVALPLGRTQHRS